MTNHELIDMVERLAGYYGRKVDENRINLIYPKVSYIPSEAIPWLLAHITDEAEQMPSNLGKAIVAAWHEWQRNHRQRMAQKDVFDCPECRYGYIFVEKGASLELETAVFLCQRCRQAAGGIPAARAEDLVMQGWRRQPIELAVQKFQRA